MQILWWLAPPALATVLAMLWAAWRGRTGREIDREAAVRRLGVAMAKPTRVPARPEPTRVPATGERSTGVAVRPSSRPTNTRRAS